MFYLTDDLINKNNQCYEMLLVFWHVQLSIFLLNDPRTMQEMKEIKKWPLNWLLLRRYATRNGLTKFFILTRYNETGLSVKQ